MPVSYFTSIHIVEAVIITNILLVVSPGGLPYQ